MEGHWFSLCTLGSSTEKSNRHDLTMIHVVMKVALTPVNPLKFYGIVILCIEKC